MGIVNSTIKLLLKAHQDGARFDSVVTLGRQGVTVSPERIVKTFNDHGIPTSAEFIDELRSVKKWRAEAIFRNLGAKRVDSIDVSDYEGATIIHDLNKPISLRRHRKYDLVFDAGTLEHVFEFPTAINSCMQMVKPGGHLILVTTANNYCGHGFYQFSPELFFRVLTPERGFAIRHAVMQEHSLAESSLFGVKYPFPIEGAFFNVVDPNHIKQRVELISDKPIALMIIAQRINSNDPGFSISAPFQSDYQPQWDNSEAESNPLRNTRWGKLVLNKLQEVFTENFCRETLPMLARLIDPFRVLRWKLERSFSNKRLYKRLRNFKVYNKHK